MRDAPTRTATHASAPWSAPANAGRPVRGSSRPAGAKKTPSCAIAYTTKGKVSSDRSRSLGIADILERMRVAYPTDKPLSAHLEEKTSGPCHMNRPPATRMGMNKVHGLVVLALALSVATGCSQSRKSAPATSEAAQTVAGGEMKAGAPVSAGRALVVTMDVGITVVDLDKARGTIRAEVERAGGYIADASSAGSGSERSAHMELRVPATKAQGIRAALGGLGEITTDVEKVQDVTEERADLEARLHNARVQEKRILEIMTQKTGAIHEVIEAEKAIARIREAIERMEAQKRTLDGRVDLATVRVTLTSQPGPAAWQTPGKSIAGAAHAGGQAAAATGVYAIMAFVAAAPILVPVAAVIIGMILVFRNKRRARQVGMAALSAG